MKNTTLYFIRHGEVHNPKKILYGRLPGFRLAERGLPKVADLAEDLSAKKIEVLFTSPLLRARQTGKIISERTGLIPKISRLITEVDILYQGLPLSQFKGIIEPVLFSDENVRKGQESAEVIRNRVLKFLRHVLKEHRGKRIAVVSHGDPIVIFMSYVLDKKFSWEFKLKNYLKTATYYVFTYDESAQKWKFTHPMT